jgi:hypothetical protein
MKTITVERFEKVENKDKESFPNIAFFQIVNFHINFYGKQMVLTEDTRITTDGRQFVINGNGFIPQDFELTSL